MSLPVRRLAAEDGQTTVLASTIQSNTTSFSGGGLEGLLSSQVNVVNSTLTGNNAADYGGGAEAKAGGVVTLYNTTVTNNRADYLLAGSGKGGGVSASACPAVRWDWG